MQKLCFCKNTQVQVSGVRCQEGMVSGVRFQVSGIEGFRFQVSGFGFQGWKASDVDVRNCVRIRKPCRCEFIRTPWADLSAFTREWISSQELCHR